MLRLRVAAPFAAFRPLVAGAFRSTAPFMTPSAAYGLLLNVAAIESREDDGSSPMTVTKSGLPGCEIALGARRLPMLQLLYQQLHNYPVGRTNEDWATQTRGNKHNIQPVRRAFLSDLDAMVCVRANDALEARIRDGLRLGARFEPERHLRYGVLFLGDNNFTLSHLHEVEPEPARWYVAANGLEGSVGDTCRLTVWIDRRDSSRTVTRLFQCQEGSSAEPPEGAWTAVPPARDD